MFHRFHRSSLNPCESSLLLSISYVRFDPTNIFLFNGAAILAAEICKNKYVQSMRGRVCRASYEYRVEGASCEL